MSRFHFDENVIENAAASLKAVNQELGGCLVELTLIKTVVQKEKGYNINEICNKLGNENDKLKYCCERTVEGINSVNEISLIVKQYNNLAKSKYYKLNDSFSNIDYAYIGEKVSEYNSDFDVITAGVFDGINDGLNFKFVLEGYEEQAIRNGLDKILANLGMDDNMYKKDYNDLIKSTFDEVSTLKKLIPHDKSASYEPFFTIMSSFSERYKINADVYAELFSKYYQVMEYLDTMKQAYADNPQILKENENMRATYCKSFTNEIMSLKKWLSQMAVDKVTSEIVKKAMSKIGGGTFFSAAGIASSMVFQTSGYGDIYSSNQTLQGIDCVRKNTYTSYLTAIEKLKSGKYDENDVVNAHNLFDVYKSCLISEYKQMINLENSKRESDLNFIYHSDMLLSSRRNEVNAKYDAIIAEYQNKIDEVNNLENPILLANQI